ncbi:GATA type zinc finger transcription factor family protein [Dorcoceras hygrometricum]|uniref:GATA type zinc finger transcription factor family protein n=1 Tax=Dorcoceras hygrometricum TaxID=472368 RepID=A0A2Z6ZQM3_9LAMI|nr:GATA type zinc finger transcription factor family protein [Dorcoceras hygrometricum]
MQTLHARRWPTAADACCATTCDDGRTERRYRSTLEARCAHDGCARFVHDGCVRFAHDVASPWRGVSHAVAARFVDGGGRRPIAAPASFRRCRDGWSNFF